MKANYNSLGEFFLDLSNHVEQDSVVKIDLTTPVLKDITLGDSTVLSYLKEEMWDDCMCFGNGTNFTFELPLAEADITQYSALWKPKWEGLKVFLSTLYSKGVETVEFYLGVD